MGEPIALGLRLVNCGETLLKVMPPGRCTGDTALLLEMERGNDSYVFYDGAPEGLPDDLKSWTTSFGPICLQITPQEILPPGSASTRDFTWNGSVRKLLYLVEEGTSFTGYLATGRALWAEPGTYTLHATYRDEASGISVNATPIRIRLQAPREPDPDRFPGYTLWTPALPPLNTSLPARTTQPDSRPPGSYLPWNIEAAANASHAKWLGDNFTNTHVKLTGWNYTASCTLSTTTCDRWGWNDYYLLDYKIDAPELNASIHLGNLPVTPDGLVVEDEIWGYPDCRRVPIECDLAINETNAIQIAREAGLNETHGPMHALFTIAFRPVYPTDPPLIGARPDVYVSFAWLVHNASDETGGEAKWIDANDGRILLDHDFVGGFAFADCSREPC